MFLEDLPLMNSVPTVSPVPSVLPVVTYFITRMSDPTVSDP